LKLAAKWTANYRQENPAPGEIRAHMFGKNIIRQLQTQKGCVGIRMYYALNNEGVKKIILVGVDAEGRDIEEGIVADFSSACPPDCGSGTGQLLGNKIV
jgi:hypothetical protein